MNKKFRFLLTLICVSAAQIVYVNAQDKSSAKPVIVWQPSHQTDTGVDFSEAEVCNAIVEAAMKAKPRAEEYKVWSLGKEGLHHADAGTNTKTEHTTAVVDGKISGYAYELRESDRHQPQVFIAVHNNGGSKRNAVWGYIHEGDAYEAANRGLAERLTKAISNVTNMENRGVYLDSSTGRNDYKSPSSGKLAFYSIDNDVNNAPYRVLLEIGDNKESRALLLDPKVQKEIGAAIKKELMKWITELN